MWWLLALLVAPSPSLSEAGAWLGRYRAGPETVGFRWEEALVYDHGNISIPVDGEWHETVPEFAVRHRVTWVAERGVVLLEETHDRSHPWRYELRLDRDAGHLLKVAVEGEESIVRTYVREKR